MGRAARGGFSVQRGDPPPLQQQGPQHSPQQIQQRLHDGLGQCLALAAIQIDHAAQDLQGREAPALRRARALVGEALQELRTLLHGLQPAGGDPAADLPAQLTACVRRLNALQAVPVGCWIDGVPVRMPAGTGELLLSATRELLINACKHGQGLGVEARLRYAGPGLSITVVERSAAAPPTAHAPPGAGASAAAPGHGLGLPAMRRDLAAIGARLRWRCPGAGGVQARISWSGA